MTMNNRHQKHICVEYCINSRTQPPLPLHHFFLLQRWCCSRTELYLEFRFFWIETCHKQQQKGRERMKGREREKDKTREGTGGKKRERDSMSTKERERERRTTGNYKACPFWICLCDVTHSCLGYVVCLFWACLRDMMNWWVGCK